MLVEKNILFLFYYWFGRACDGSLDWLFNFLFHLIIIENFLHLAVHENDDFSLAVESGLGSFFIDPLAYYLGS